MAGIWHETKLTRRALLSSAAAAAAGVGAAKLLGPSYRLSHLEGLASSTLRLPNSLPDLSRPPGTPHPGLPFDHVIIVMMENHSFDNFLGDLSRTRPEVVGQFSEGVGYVNHDDQGRVVEPWHLDTTCQGDGVDQSWNVTHESMFWSYGESPQPESSYTSDYEPARYDWLGPLGQVPLAARTMQGFVLANGGIETMGYWTSAELPFTHSMANAFTIANYWFCSAPCQTYPNRRFLMAGTAFGDVSTDMSTIISGSPPFIAAPPPNGTIWDRLSDHGVSWRNYFTDLPTTGIIPTTIEKYPENIVPIAEFYADCAAGTLPAVSLVDSDEGLLGVAAQPIASLPIVQNLPGVQAANGFVQTVNGDQEGPANMAYGEQFVSRVVNAVLRSPAWARTLLIWTFDEHGGYADHVPPPPAIPPDGIEPDLSPSDFKGGYDLYGPRVPAVIVSPYSRPGGVSNVVYDHTSVLATIEAKWNLPALTYRDANANTVLDCLDLSAPALLEPPELLAPLPVLPQGFECTGTGDTTGTNQQPPPGAVGGAGPDASGVNAGSPRGGDLPRSAWSFARTARSRS